MHYEILDKNRINILPKLVIWQDRFYLAGGTALALYLGHRDSIDFDFFTQNKFDENKLVSEINEVFNGCIVQIVQLENQTVTVLIDNDIKISFFYYEYKMIEYLIKDEYFEFASVIDIACMKLSAICSRSVSKDYIDLYFILKYTGTSLFFILEKCKVKYPNIDISVILKSLVYFNELVEDPIKMILEKDLNIEKVKKFIIQKTEEVYNYK